MTEYFDKNEAKFLIKKIEEIIIERFKPPSNFLNVIETILAVAVAKYIKKERRALYTDRLKEFLLNYPGADNLHYMEIKEEDYEVWKKRLVFMTLLIT